jgi:hypothetical protein
MILKFEQVRTENVAALGYFRLGLLSRHSMHKTIKYHVKKCKAIPVTGRGGPKGCETSRIPHFLDSWLTDGGEVVRLTRRQPMYWKPQPRSKPLWFKIYFYLFLISCRYGSTRNVMHRSSASGFWIPHEYHFPDITRLIAHVSENILTFLGFIAFSCNLLYCVSSVCDLTLSFFFAVKVPQITKILQNQTAEGISFLSIVLDLFAITSNMSYNVIKGFPFR